MWRKKDFAKGFLSGVLAVTLLITGGKSLSVVQEYLVQICQQKQK